MRKLYKPRLYLGVSRDGTSLYRPIPWEVVMDIMRAALRKFVCSPEHRGVRWESVPGLDLEEVRGVKLVSPKGSVTVLFRRCCPLTGSIDLTRLRRAQRSLEEEVALPNRPSLPDNSL